MRPLQDGSLISYICIYIHDCNSLYIIVNVVIFLWFLFHMDRKAVPFAIPYVAQLNPFSRKHHLKETTPWWAASRMADNWTYQEWSKIRDRTKHSWIGDMVINDPCTIFTQHFTFSQTHVPTCLGVSSPCLAIHRKGVGEELDEVQT